MHILRKSKEDQAQASILSQLGDIFGISHEVKDKIQFLTSSFVAKAENDQDDDSKEPESHVPFPPDKL